MSEDFEHQLILVRNTNNNLRKWILLIDIQDRLESSGNGAAFLRIGAVTAEMKLAVATARRQYNLYDECREILEELDYDREQMEHELNLALNGEGPQHTGKFTMSQQQAFNAVKNAVQGKGPKQIYIDARGGTGKTFVLNRILNFVRLLDDNAIGIGVAFTGIAAQLLKGGRTFNSRFKFPLKPDKRSTCNIPKQSGLAKLIRKARIIL